MRRATNCSMVIFFEWNVFLCDITEAWIQIETELCRKCLTLLIENKSSCQWLEHAIEHFKTHRDFRSDYPWAPREGESYHWKRKCGEFQPMMNIRHVKEFFSLFFNLSQLIVYAVSSAISSETDLSFFVFFFRLYFSARTAYTLNELIHFL